MSSRRALRGNGHADSTRGGRKIASIAERPNAERDCKRLLAGLEVPTSYPTANRDPWAAQDVQKGRAVVKRRTQRFVDDMVRENGWG